MRAQQKVGIAFRSVVSGIVLLLTLIAFMGLGKASATTAGNTFYIAANGSDANNGTSKTTPWLHAPGMPACSASCASYTPKPGDSFIFRGGDTWHFGNNSANPYTGGTWQWGWSGTSGNCVYEGSQTSCIYIGVDPTWYSGSSMSRPILTEDNPLTPNPGKWSDSVSSCSYQTTTQNEMIIDSGSYNVWDNFEMTGLCQQDISSSPHYGNSWDLYINDANWPNTYKNLYIHGWTHVPFSCSLSGGEPVGHCFQVAAFQGSGSSTSTLGPSFVCDGADSDPGGAGCIIGFGYRMVRSILRYNAQGEGGGCHDIHDNIWEYWASTGDQLAHGNAWECNSDFGGSTPNVFYNNIFRHITPGIVDLWMTPNPSPAEYWFNNIMYDAPGGNYMDVDNSHGSQSGSQFLFNNTFEMQGGMVSCRPGMTDTNNQYITEGSTQYVFSGCATSNELKMNHATSDSQGYTTSNTFNDYPNFGGPSPTKVDTCATEANSCIPTAAGNSTVGKGASWQNYCTALASFTSDPADVDAANACQRDTTTACSYDATNHVVNCPSRTTDARGGVWDIGAFEYNSQTQPPNPPTGLSAVVN